MSEKTAMKKYNVILRKIERMVGKGSTSTAALSQAGRQVLGNMYRGTFAVDHINYDLLSQQHPFLICNLDESRQSGTHWVGMCLNIDGKIIVYDSFGRKSSKILSSLRMFDIIDTDYDVEQRLSDDNCGARSLAWLVFFQLYGEEAAMLI